MIFLFKGINISAELSNSVRIKQDGLYLSISPITAAHQGQYMCLVKEANMDMLRTYDIEVTGKKHAVMFFIVHMLHNAHHHCVNFTCGTTSNQHLCLFAVSLAFDIKAAIGSTIYLPCNFPHPGQVMTNAVWYKETGSGLVALDFGDESTGEMQRRQQLYLLDYDQSLIFRNVMTEDSGTYHCKTVEGDQLSTVRVSITGRSIALMIHF